MNSFFRHGLSIVALIAVCSNALANQTIKATLLDNAIQLSATSVKAGTVTIDVSNASDTTQTHEFVILRTDQADGKLKVKNGQVLESAYKKIGEVEDIVPGKSKHMTVRLAPGHYVVICNNPGHYAMGMHASLVVVS